MSEPEFARPIDIRHLPERAVDIAATPEECAALAARFDLVGIARLVASLTLAHDGKAVSAKGRMEADFVQTCAVSGDDLPGRISGPVAFRFVPAAALERGEEEIELDAEDLDVIEFDGHHVDLGEAVAQSLALGIDPFAVGPTAQEARRRAGLLDERQSGPFAALAALKKPD